MIEFTPRGLKQHDDAAAPVTGVVSAAAAVAQLKEQFAAQEAARVAAPAAKRTDAPLEILKPRHFVKELRARLRAVERQIRALRRLEDEAAEIRRLIAAAKSPPARVRNITTARTAG